MPKRGHLVVIGGAEDREDAMTVLTTVASLSGGKQGHIVVLTTASRLAEQDPARASHVQETYERAFSECGCGKVSTLHIHDRDAANDPACAAKIRKATGIFMAGGDQKRLVNILGGTAVGEAMHEAFEHHGACVSGTSAGASALSEHMMGGGPSEILPRKGLVPLAPGLGFLPHVVIDQHFSQRQRLGRLIAVIAQNPFLIGIGIDEDTGLVITPTRSLEVVGSGAVTMLDGRHTSYTNVNDVETGEVLAVTDIQLHLLPAGFRFDLRHAEHKERLVMPVSFEEMLASVMVAH